jgi:hypothetical protein
MASVLNLFWATSSAGSGCYSYTRNNNKDQQNQYPKQLRPKPEVRLPRQRGWGGTDHSNILTRSAFWVPNTIASFLKTVNGSLRQPCVRSESTSNSLLQQAYDETTTESQCCQRMFESKPAMNWMPGITLPTSSSSLVRNRSVPTLAAQARWIASAEESPVPARISAYRSAVSKV